MPLTHPAGILAWLVGAYHAGLHGVTVALHAVAKHTGVPVVVVAAIGLVISYRLLRRGARLAFEVSIVVVLLLVATRLGWIHW
jgi:hypothetical protein